MIIFFEGHNASMRGLTGAPLRLTLLMQWLIVWLRFCRCQVTAGNRQCELMTLFPAMIDCLPGWLMDDAPAYAG